MRKHALGVCAAFLFACSCTGYAESKELTMTILSDWSLYASDHSPLIQTDHPFIRDPKEVRGFADHLADGLANRDIRFSGTTLVIGRKFGRGWGLYFGKSPGVRKSGLGVGVEYSIRW